MLDYCSDCLMGSLGRHLCAYGRGTLKRRRRRRRRMEKEEGSELRYKASGERKGALTKLVYKYERRELARVTSGSGRVWHTISPADNTAIKVLLVPTRTWLPFENSTGQCFEVYSSSCSNQSIELGLKSDWLGSADFWCSSRESKKVISIYLSTYLSTSNEPYLKELNAPTLSRKRNTTSQPLSIC